MTITRVTVRMNMDLRAEQQVAETAARVAGEIIRLYYDQGGAAIETKADQSPVTQADKDANAAILAILTEAFPDDAILSEETPDTEARLAAKRVWIIDPLDGTKDFINRSGEFAVAFEESPVHSWNRAIRRERFPPQVALPADPFGSLLSQRRPTAPCGFWSSNQFRTPTPSVPGAGPTWSVVA